MSWEGLLRLWIRKDGVSGYIIMTEENIIQMESGFLNSGQEISFEAPPGVAIIVIQSLHQARHKRTNSVHVLLVTRLLWNNWRRHMHNSEYLMLDIPTGSGYIWTQEMHGTLILSNFPLSQQVFMGTPEKKNNGWSG